MCIVEKCIVKMCRCALCRCANPWPGPPSCVIVQSSGQNRDTQPQTILHISYIFKQSYTDTNHIFLYCSISFSPNKYFLLLYYQTFLGGLGCSRVLLGLDVQEDSVSVVHHLGSSISTSDSVSLPPAL